MPEEIAIIGAGVIGLSIAYELSKKHENIYVFEKTPYVGDGQSTRNSGVIHAGIYYPKETLKAKLCIEGNKLLYEFCEQHSIQCKKTGKLIVATNYQEDKKLEELLEMAKSKEMEDAKLISGNKTRQYEPNVNATTALYLGTTGIIDAGEYVNTLSRLARNNGAEILKKTEVTDITAKNGCFTLKTDSRGEIDVKYLINAAGLYSDAVARMINPGQSHQISPVRGEYYTFSSNKQGLEMKMNIYPCPKPAIVGVKHRTVGIHLTPTFDNGKIIVGPTAFNIESKTDFTEKRKNQDYFYKEIKDFFPNIKKEDLQEDFAGIRAKLRNQYDFEIKTDEKYPNCLHLIGIDSPGLTSSQAIAKRVGIDKGKIYFKK